MEELNELRKIAEQATQDVWYEALVGPGEEEVWIVDSGISYICSTQIGDDRGAHDSIHIATFDPPTALALLSRLEQAEQAVARVRDVIKGAPTVDPLRGFAGPPDDWPDDTHFTSYGEWIMANRVREALDGEPNE